jgi:PHD/YefM family antitoxin component YafN of YafNO toxin-antitoxin module
MIMNMISSTEARKRFGHYCQLAVEGDAIVVARYGRPRVLILDFQRYEDLLDKEQELLRLRVPR